MSELLTDVADVRRRFMELVVEVRPELHRYCTRMTGSVFDGEDVVQDALAKAFYGLTELEALPSLRPWLFRIAHNCAMDFLRRYEQRHVEAADMSELPEPAEPDLDGARVEAALEIFAVLPPLQRSALALKDVLGHSLEETAATMGTSVAAVKAALVRGRANVAAAVLRAKKPAAVDDLRRLRRYADLFNAHDWDGLRALFGEETRLDVVSRYQRRGRAAGEYFTQYAQIAPREDLRAKLGWVGDVPTIAMFRPSAPGRPAYFVTIDWKDEGVARVRDFRYVPYIAREAEFTTGAVNQP